MSGISGISTTYTLPNYHGELIATTPAETPLLSAAGGVNGGGSVTDTLVEWQSYDLRAPEIRARLEGANAPTGESRVRANITNRVQIFQEAVSTSYTKQAATGRYATAAGGAENPVMNEHSWQVTQALTQIATDVNYSFWHAVRNDPADNTTARQMAGLFSVITSNAQYKKAEVTGASAATDTITVTHDLAVGDKVVFTAVGAATAIAVRRAYWVTAIGTTATFKVSATAGGAAIAIGTASGLAFYPLKVANILTVDDIGGLLQSVYDNGGISEQGTATIMVPSGQKRAITHAYSVAGTAANPLVGSRNLGGVSVDTIITDFGTLNVAIDRALPLDALSVVSVDQLQPVFLAIPDKGVMFEEELAKVGAADNTQIYGEVGLKYGHESRHGLLRGLFA